MLNRLTPFLQKPALYEKSTSEFWNDDHISREMLEAHLNPKWDGATRKLEFVNKSVNWITAAFPSKEYPNLIDFGCGPGIYAERFYEKGYGVTGVDFSRRSIAYAKESATKKGLDIEYVYRDYLQLSYRQQFDLATMIYCDFGVLSGEDRTALLKIIYNALKPNGAIVFDAFTPNFYKEKQESGTWEYCETGFFSKEPYVNLQSFFRYDECNTFLDQYIILTDREIQCYNLWNHGFTVQELKKDLSAAGFCDIELYSDISGNQYDENSNTVCVVARKEEGTLSTAQCLRK